MPPPYSSKPPSDQANPRGRQLPSSTAGMAATQLPSVGPRSLPPPFAVAHQERPMLPPLSSGSEIPAEHAPYSTGRTWSSSQYQSPSSPLYYGQHTFPEPSQAPWSARLPLERILSRPEQDRPASSGTVHPPSSPAQSPYRSYAYHDPGQTSPVRMRAGFPSLPSPSGQDMRPLMAEATRYRASSTTMPSTRRESESSRSSATSSSAYGSALSMPPQPTGLTSSSQSSDM